LPSPVSSVAHGLLAVVTGFTAGLPASDAHAALAPQSHDGAADAALASPALARTAASDAATHVNLFTNSPSLA
jgi:hypothetical protein